MGQNAGTLRRAFCPPKLPKYIPRVNALSVPLRPPIATRHKDEKLRRTYVVLFVGSVQGVEPCLSHQGRNYGRVTRRDSPRLTVDAYELRDIQPRAPSRRRRE